MRYPASADENGFPMKLWLGRLALGSVAALALGFAPPPAISDAEREAVGIVADHLARGPEAFLERLADDSPLEALSPSAALAEIKARVGPSAGSVWELRTASDQFRGHGAVFHVTFASGVDDVVILDLNEASPRRIREIRTMAELPPGSRRQELSQTGLPSTGQGLHGRILTFAFLAPILAIAGAVLRSRKPRTTSGLLAAALLIFALTLATLIDPQWSARLVAWRDRIGARTHTAGEEPEIAIASMRDLVAARHALAEGLELPEVGPAGSEAAAIRDLWAFSTAASADPETISKGINALPFVSRSPLATLMLARNAAFQGASEAASKQYEQLRRQGPEHDAFAVEELVLTNSLSSREMAARMATRDAFLHYHRVMQAALLGRLTDARREFQGAWALHPISRTQMLESGPLSLLLHDSGIAQVVQLFEPEERKEKDLALSRNPIEVPAETHALAAGSYLQLAIGTARLEVPGGAAIAPRGTAVVSAQEIERQVNESAFLQLKHRGGAVSSAGTQRSLELVLDELERRQRWTTILELTQSVSPHSVNLAAPLVSARLTALIRTGQLDKAKALATAPELKKSLRIDPDPAEMLEIAELLALSGAWDESIGMVRTAGGIHNAPDVTGRLERLELRRRLASSPPTQATAHFEMHSTPDIPVTVAERIGELLEAELQRISSHLTVKEFRPIRVNVVTWSDFSQRITGTDHILGFYDGEITVPFGTVAQFRDQVVAILSHELTHAVVAQATSDRAPRWFQEGLATRMELVERQENIFAIRNGEPLLALELLDPMLVNAMDPDGAAEAYVAAQTFIRFLEDRFGSDSLRRLIADFAAGTDSEEALRRVTGSTPLELDHQFRIWGLTHSAAFIDQRPWPYMRYYSLGIDPSVRNNIHFGASKQGRP